MKDLEISLLRCGYIVIYNFLSGQGKVLLLIMGGPERSLNYVVRHHPTSFFYTKEKKKKGFVWKNTVGV